MLRDDRRGRRAALESLRLDPRRGYAWALAGAGLFGGAAAWRLIRVNQALKRSLGRAAAGAGP
jgi:hypothetical protein